MAFFHHIAAFSLFSALIYQGIVIRKPFTQQTAQSLIKSDQLYGLSALTILLVGFARVLYLEKGAAFYFHSMPFIIKISLFVLIGILSIYPSVTFFSWRTTIKKHQFPDVSLTTLTRIRRVIYIEVAALIAVILCAAMMAKGVGYIAY
tara:strand:+ start:76 stop:519 length:444 start_codon:yes stop_codon:yes gene_type:complete